MMYNKYELSLERIGKEAAAMFGRKNKWKRWMAGALAACTLWGSGVVTAVLQVPSFFAVDAGAASDLTVKQVSLSALLASLLPKDTEYPLTEAEANWLDYDSKDPTLSDLRSALALSHRISLPLSLLTVDEEAADGGMVVRLRAYTESGVTWYPTGVGVSGQGYTPSRVGDVYEVTLPEAVVSAAEVLTVSVDYEAVFPLDRVACERLANAAHTAVKDARAQQIAYEAALPAYQQQLDAYNAYLEAFNQYKADMQRYNSYKKAYEQYKAEQKRYEQYVADMETYRVEREAYEAYLAAYAEWEEAYRAYLGVIEGMDEYEQKYQAYVQWQNDMALVRAQLAVVESCYVADSAGHRLYGTLRGDTVATVVNRQDELVSAGCDAGDIAKADAATAALIDWLNGYQPLKTEKDCYTYYVQHAEELKNNVKQLYTALARLYNNQIVPEILTMQEKLERYHQFVAQLYVLWCALDDGMDRSADWNIAGKSAEWLLESCFLLVDKNRSTPLAAYPTEQELVTSPSDLKAPVPPKEVLCPREPAKVVQPVEPEEVRQPVVPKVVAKPDAPTAPAFSTYLTALMGSGAQAVEHGRTLPDGDCRYTAQIRQDWVVQTTDDCVLKFYNADGSALLMSPMTVKEGDEFSLPSKSVLDSAVPDDTRQYTYEGMGWVDENGKWLGAPGDTLTATEDMLIYANYRATLRHYTVTWVVGDTRTEVTVPYGTLPVYEGEGGGSLIWTPPVDEVTEDVTYVGTYPVKPHYTVTWKWGDGEDEQMQLEYVAGQIPVFPGTVEKENDGRYEYTFVAWSPEVTELTEDTVYVAEFEAMDRMPGLPEGATVTLHKGGVSGEGWFSEDGRVTVDLSYVLSRMTADMTVRADGVAVRLLEQTVTALAALDGVELTLNRVGNDVSFILTAMSGEERVPVAELLPEGVSVEAEVGLASDGGTRATVTADGQIGASVSVQGDGFAWFDAMPAVTYEVAFGYAVRVDTCEIGVLAADVAWAQVGQTVTVTWQAQKGYRLCGLRVQTAEGVVEAVATADGYTFCMPRGDVTVTADVEQIQYEISFYSNGQLLSKKWYFYGQTVEEPTVPVSQDGRSFVRWSPDVLPVTADAVYEAVFFDPNQRDDQTDDVLNQKYGVTIGDMIVIFSVSWAVVSGGILTWFFVRRRKRTSRADEDV